MGQTSISLESAVERLLERTPVPKEHESASLIEALGRISYMNLKAQTDAPPFDNSPVDGFALCHTDLAEASEDSPAVLRVAETLYAGDAPAESLAPGTCVRVMTGAPIPPGATCVVRYEDTDNGKTYVNIPISLKKHQNYRFKGEDIRKDQDILLKGEYITPVHIGILAGQGYTDAPVFKRPKVGVLSTGSELMSGNQPLKPGKIYDSNRYMLGAKAAVSGGEPVFSPNAADDPETIAEALKTLLKACDFAVTTGGVSVGDRDYMPLAGKILEAEPVFRGVQMKPGGWITAFRLDEKLILCLSGNPGAASISFDLLAGPVIRRLAGCLRILPRRTQCILRKPFPKSSESRRFLYAHLEDGGVVPSSTGFVSGCLGSVVGCNGILDIPAGTPPLSAGDAVTVILAD